MSRWLAVVSTALGAAALLTPGLSETAEAAPTGTPELRRVVIKHWGQTSKLLREIDAIRSKPPTSDYAVLLLVGSFARLETACNKAVAAIRRSGGHAGLRAAATRMFTQMALWADHSSSMIGHAYHGRRTEAAREERIAAGCLKRARRASEDVSRLLRATG